jgi:hypothetical protein
MRLLFPGQHDSFQKVAPGFLSAACFGSDWNVSYYEKHPQFTMEIEKFCSPSLPEGLPGAEPPAFFRRKKPRRAYSVVPQSRQNL